MLNFKNIQISDKKEFDKYLKKYNQQLCSYCFTDIFIWRFFYSTQFCINNNCLFIRHKIPGTEKVCYLPPIGENGKVGCIDTLIKETYEREHDLFLTSISDEIREQIEERYPDKFEFNEIRDNFEYIYLSENLIELVGKKFHKKKNLCNKFMSEYEGRWEYKNISIEEIREIFAYQLNWCESNCVTGEKNFINETCAISSILKNYNSLGMLGGAIRLDGKIIAYTLASPVRDDTCVIQIEKADSTITGAYQMINREFARANLSCFKYINREEDMGIEGLRKAKLSYQPIILAKCYNAKFIG